MTISLLAFARIRAGLLNYEVCCTAATRLTPGANTNRGEEATYEEKWPIHLAS